jgi:hypothetical protein
VKHAPSRLGLLRFGVCLLHRPSNDELTIHHVRTSSPRQNIELLLSRRSLLAGSHIVVVVAFVARPSLLGCTVRVQGINALIARRGRHLFSGQFPAFFFFLLVVCESFFYNIGSSIGTIRAAGSSLPRGPPAKSSKFIACYLTPRAASASLDGVFAASLPWSSIFGLIILMGRIV